MAAVSIPLAKQWQEVLKPIQKEVETRFSTDTAAIVAEYALPEIIHYALRQLLNFGFGDQLAPPLPSNIYQIVVGRSQEMDGKILFLNPYRTVKALMGVMEEYRESRLGPDDKSLSFALFERCAKEQHLERIVEPRWKFIPVSSVRVNDPKNESYDESQKALSLIDLVTLHFFQRVGTGEGVPWGYYRTKSMAAVPELGYALPLYVYLS
jgi:hypothetical protein